MVAAVRYWNKEESQFAKRIQTETINECLLKKWLKHWNVQRNINDNSGIRESVAKYLGECARPEILDASEADLPGMIESISMHLKNENWTNRNARPTSLASKFVFSLRPEDVAPYDSRARAALRIVCRSPLKDHDYKAYWKAFQSFTCAIDQCLEKHMKNMTEKFQEEFKESKMTDKLFKLRAADKALMWIGGYEFKDITPEDIRARFKTT